MGRCLRQRHFDAPRVADSPHPIGVAAQFPADRRGRTTHDLSDCPQRGTGCCQVANRFAFGQGQAPGVDGTLHRRQMRKLSGRPGRSSHCPHTMFVVHHPPIGINASITRLPDALVPVPGRAYIRSDLLGCLPTGPAGLAQLEVSLTARTRRPARLPRDPSLPRPLPAHVRVQAQLGGCRGDTPTARQNTEEIVLLLLGVFLGGSWFPG